MAVALQIHFAFILLAVPLIANGEEPLRDVIDKRVKIAWQKNKVTPAQSATDAEFLRRVYIDLLGTIPTYGEAVSFLDDKSPGKRAKLIDRLLDDPRYARHQAEVWDMVYFGRNPPGFGTDKRDGFQNWLREQFAKNVPYDQWARQILRAEGNTVEQGAPMFFVQYRNEPQDATVAVAAKFLGIQLQCARCHDHPFDDWSQTDFYGMAAFYSRLQVVSVGKKNKETAYAIGEKRTGEILFTGPAAKQKPGRKGEPIQPKFLHGKQLAEPEVAKGFKDPRNFPSGKMPPKPSFSRKDALADWITSKDNPYFARAVANRVWAQYVGRGLVHPVDNVSPENPARYPELLNAITRQLVAHKFDLKWYVREIVNSQAYQLSSMGSVTEAMPEWYERARTRPLSAEELLDSWKTAIRYDKVSAVKKSTDRYAPLGSGYLLRFFGRPNNGVGDFQGGLHEHLYLNNGGMSRVLTTQKGSLHYALLNSKEPWEKRVDELYLSVLTRRPNDEERKRFVEHLTGGDASERLSEAIWVLMTCSEFRFNH